jgi:hypothetical protein
MLGDETVHLKDQGRPGTSDGSDDRTRHEDAGAARRDLSNGRRHGPRGDRPAAWFVGCRGRHGLHVPSSTTRGTGAIPESVQRRRRRERQGGVEPEEHESGGVSQGDGHRVISSFAFGIDGLDGRGRAALLEALRGRAGAVLGGSAATERADVVLDNTDPARPRIVSW